MKIFQLKEIHFIILIIVFTAIMYLISCFNKNEDKAINDNIPEIGDAFLPIH